MDVKYAGEEKYADIDGCRICYVDEGEGPPLLLIHGIGGSMTNWTPTIEHFKRFRRVVAMDLPAHGKSQIVDADYSVDFLAGKVRGLLAMLGIDRVTIAGNSLGGLTSLYLTLNHPDLVEGLVLVDTAGGHRFPWMLRQAFRKLPLDFLKRAVTFFSSRLLKYQVLYRLAGVYVLNQYTTVLIKEAMWVSERPDADEFMEAYIRTGHTALGVDFRDRLCEISKPTLIVWGQKDLGVPLKVGQSINKMIRGSFLVAIPGAAHVPQLDQPEQFNAAVESFLKGV